MGSSSDLEFWESLYFPVVFIVGSFLFFFNFNFPFYYSIFILLTTGVPFTVAHLVLFHYCCSTSQSEAVVLELFLNLNLYIPEFIPSWIEIFVS